MLKLIREVIGAAWLSLKSDDRLNESMKVVQPVFVELYSSKKFEEILNIDTFGVAWNMMHKADRYELLFVTYRKYRKKPRLVNGDIVEESLFANINQDSAIDWEDFSEKQQYAIKEAATQFMVSLVMLFSDECLVDSHKNIYTSVMRAEAEENFKTLAGVA